MPSRLRERLPWGSLRLRLAAWNTAIVLVMVVATLLAARFAARASLYDNADQELRGSAREVVLALRELFPDMDAVVDEMRRKAVSHETRGWFTQLLREDGTQIWKSEHCPDAVANFPPRKLDRVENIVQIGLFRYVRLRIAEPGQPVFHVRVGTSTAGIDASLAGLVRLLTGLGLALAGVTPLAGWWLATRSIRPVADILATADRLEASRLGDRLPVRGVGDELDHLAATINGLLDDVAAHVDRQQQFVADAAHELRSPLAAVRSGIEVTLAYDRTTAEYREALEEVLEETRSLAKLANGLLLLAETGSESAPLAATPLDLVAIIDQAVAMFSGVAEDRDVALHVTCDGPAMIEGDAGQLRQMIGNLLDNAIRFTPAGGSVALRVASEPRTGRITFTVTDTGPGIAPEHLPRVFDRFFKIDPSRSRIAQTRSGGLGLPICKAIVERHGGSISVTSRVGQGTTVTVELPRLPDPPSPAASPASRADADRVSVPIGNS